MKPVIVLPKGMMSPEDIKLLNDNDMCAVECDDPAAVKFLDPIPSISSRTEIENAAIKLSRLVLAGNFTSCPSRADFASMFIDILTKGTALDATGLPPVSTKRK